MVPMMCLNPLSLEAPLNMILKSLIGGATWYFIRGYPHRDGTANVQVSCNQPVNISGPVNTGLTGKQLHLKKEMCCWCDSDNNRLSTGYNSTWIGNENMFDYREQEIRCDSGAGINQIALISFAFF